MKYHGFYATLVFASWVGYVLIVYPSHRVISLFEFITDGYAPTKLANKGQQVLALLMGDGFQSHLFSHNMHHDSYIVNKLVSYMRSSGRKTLIELAAGSGIASCRWAQMIRTAGLNDAVVLLTDLQPDLKGWAYRRNEFGRDKVHFLNRSVDAMNFFSSIDASTVASDELPPDLLLGGHIRVINFALHHFTPDLASKIIADVIKSRSSILIGDLSPNPGGLLWNWLLALKYGVHEILINGISPMDMWTAPLLPLLPFMACWDATVSVLRAYSTTEILDMLNTHIQQEKQDTGTCFYDIDTWTSSSFANWIGMPRALIAGLHYLGLRPYDPVMQFVFARPKC